MERPERNWFLTLIAIAVAFNALTLSPLVPWQRWLLWSRPQPVQRVEIEVSGNQFHLPARPIQLRAGEFVEFTATSGDVTYGLGVFCADGTLVFQMQVIPGHRNRLVWKFDAPGLYDIRSTEYSGLKHPAMVVPGAIEVLP